MGRENMRRKRGYQKGRNLAITSFETLNFKYHGILWKCPRARLPAVRFDLGSFPLLDLNMYVMGFIRTVVEMPICEGNVNWNITASWLIPDILTSFVLPICKHHDTTFSISLCL